MNRTITYGLLYIGFVVSSACAPSVFTNAPESPTPTLGDTVSFDDSEWVVIGAKDAGKTLESHVALFPEQKKTDGHFVQVHFKAIDSAL